MAAADVRDMLDLPADGGQPRPHKKQKVVEKRPGTAEMGEQAESEAMVRHLMIWKCLKNTVTDVRTSYREMAPFENSARSDGLVLRHWERKRAPVNETTPVETAAADGEDKNETQVAEQKPEEVYAFAKYNVKAQVPKRYTDDQYNRYLKSHIWSREETDYLMDLVEEYDLRWVVIVDRYEYPPNQPSTNGDSTALVTTTRRRTMEEMKSRYYTIAANMLALEHPPSEMSEAEFNLHEKMMKYDPEQEKARKDLATLQLNRSKDEVNEETLLLEELKRIVANEKNFIEERRELYARLEAPISTSNTTMYQSSQGLSQLLHSLLQADKTKKRRSLMALETGTSSPASQPSTQQNPPQSARESQPQTPAAPAPTPTTTKKAASAAAQQPTIKSLTPAEEAKYGVTRHERLTSGVQFRNDKAQKLTQAKSNIQSQKLAAALTELSIPPRLVMPTEKVCKEFEKLIYSVNLLLDVRKFAEKVEGEIRVLEAAKQEREMKEKERLEAEEVSKTGGDAAGAGQGNEGDKEADKETQGAAGGGGSVGEDKKTAAAAAAAATADATATSGADAPATKRHDETGAIKIEADDEPKEAGAEGAVTAGSGRTHKRSASVLSAVSDKSTKRQRK
ncbi:DNA methyltransferase 1-associated protein 1 [Blastomyces silverae]|uniref:SWR1-complex protein 4 n=1 Tax=Blastomyces silverae TaxID=2060906 RepID=A0A0H1BAL7_9EURO|nr:DNA methyltransferase 1-associated protein 1 [Blastomyces silverae]